MVDNNYPYKPRVEIVIEEYVNIIESFIKRGNDRKYISDLISCQNWTSHKELNELVYFRNIDLWQLFKLISPLGFSEVPKSNRLEFLEKVNHQFKTILNMKIENPNGCYFEGTNFFVFDDKDLQILEEKGLTITSGYKALRNILEYVYILQNQEGVVKIDSTQNVQNAMDVHEVLDPSFEFMKCYLVPTSENSIADIKNRFSKGYINGSLFKLDPKEVFEFFENYNSLTEKGFSSYENLIAFE